MAPNTELRAKVKIDFERDFFKLINNSVFGRTMENGRKHRDIRFVSTERQKSCLVAETTLLNLISGRTVIPDFGVSTAILNTIDISRSWCKLHFGSLRG